MEERTRSHKAEDSLNRERKNKCSYTLEEIKNYPKVMKMVRKHTVKRKIAHSDHNLHRRFAFVFGMPKFAITLKYILHLYNTD